MLTNLIVAAVMSLSDDYSLIGKPPVETPAVVAPVPAPVEIEPIPAPVPVDGCGDCEEVESAPIPPKDQHDHMKRPNPEPQSMLIVDPPVPQKTDIRVFGSDEYAMFKRATLCQFYDEDKEPIMTEFMEDLKEAGHSVAYIEVHVDYSDLSDPYESKLFKKYKVPSVPYFVGTKDMKPVLYLEGSKATPRYLIELLRQTDEGVAKREAVVEKTQPLISGIPEITGDEIGNIPGGLAILEFYDATLGGPNTVKDYYLKECRKQKWDVRRVPVYRSSNDRSEIVSVIADHFKVTEFPTYLITVNGKVWVRMIGTPTDHQIYEATARVLRGYRNRVPMAQKTTVKEQPKTDPYWEEYTPAVKPRSSGCTSGNCGTCRNCNR